MRKNIFALSIILTAFCLSFVSCLGDDDIEIDEEWKRLNEKEFNKLQGDDSYSTVQSLSNDGFIYWKRTTAITDNDGLSGNSDNEYIRFNDTIKCRYEGWYFDREGEKITFDTTEGDYNKVERKFAVSGLVEGWRTALQYMVAGDQREIVIPWNLGYGASGSTAIPGYTTLWFNLKVTEVIRMNGK